MVSITVQSDSVTYVHALCPLRTYIHAHNAYTHTYISMYTYRLAVKTVLVIESTVTCKKSRRKGKFQRRSYP